MADDRTATVDRDLCIASGVCEATAPDDFELDADGKAHATPPTSDPDAVQDAKDGCPSMAISWDE
jgi:ferredoxin